MTRRECFPLGLALLGNACRRVKSVGYPGYALIATSGEKSVAVLDLMQFRLGKSIGLPAEPTAIVSAASGGRAYVLTLGRQRSCFERGLAGGRIGPVCP